MNPKYSIIIPLYNKAPYIRKALESVVSQTYHDWECVVVNDGSSDNSLEVVQNFVEELKIEDRSLKIINQANAGVAATRNRGVKESEGEYVCFLDADDWWEPNFIDEIDKLIIDYPNAGIYCTNYIYYKPGKTRVALNLPRGYMNYPDAYLRSKMMPVTSITTCIPRKVFDEIGGFPVGIKLGEDFLLWAETAIKYMVAFSEKPLAYYNNDIPTSHRATRNLHAPEYHMLFHFDSLEDDIRKQSPVTGNPVEWKALLDKLRVCGLLEYWLNEKYHEMAAIELAKVDWYKQSKSVVRTYKTPIWLLKTRRMFMLIGSACKQRLIKMING